MISVVCFKWKKRADSAWPVSNIEYSAEHVHRLKNMVWRNLAFPHRFICVTDDASDIDPRIEIIPLWDKHLDLGGCYNRLYVFSPDMKKLLGDRFICIDLDCVITGDITPLVTRSEDFVINSYKPLVTSIVDQHYNGGMFMMTAGARRQVWDTFDPKRSPGAIMRAKREGTCIGTDQAWVRLILGKNEARWTEADGVYEARQVRDKLPPGARIVFFAGSRDPLTSTGYQWVREHWR